jgi:DnaJ-class molecular chaperone
MLVSPTQYMPEITWRDLGASGREAGAQEFSWTELGSRPSLYQMLEVSPIASPEVIKAAYRALMEKYHPDKHPERRRLWAEEISMQLNAAYAVLSDPRKRRDYDFAHGFSPRP